MRSKKPVQVRAAIIQEAGYNIRYYIILIHLKTMINIHFKKLFIAKFYKLLHLKNQDLISIKIINNI